MRFPLDQDSATSNAERSLVKFVWHTKRRKVFESFTSKVWIFIGQWIDSKFAVNVTGNVFYVWFTTRVKRVNGIKDQQDNYELSKYFVYFNCPIFLSVNFVLRNTKTYFFIIILWNTFYEFSSLQRIMYLNSK